MGGRWERRSPAPCKPLKLRFGFCAAVLNPWSHQRCGTRKNQLWFAVVQTAVRRPLSKQNRRCPPVPGRGRGAFDNGLGAKASGPLLFQRRCLLLVGADRLTDANDMALGGAQHLVP